ncbi:uncharacterized protein TNCV_3915671 [Trichonephila clavipes]|nr:uncharacterized protein TNCV_3915671 [Trichonephila clavipes]
MIFYVVELLADVPSRKYPRNLESPRVSSRGFDYDSKIIVMKITKRAVVNPPLHGPGGMAYSDLEKAEAFKDTLEVTFQENIEPCFDDKFEEVENVVSNYLENSTTLTPPLTFP